LGVHVKVTASVISRNITIKPPKIKLAMYLDARFLHTAKYFYL
jgi:hypothetical protein